MSAAELRLHRLLIETHTMRLMLLENRIEFLQNQFLPRIEKAMPLILPQAMHVLGGAAKPEEITPKQIFDYVIRFDPDPVKKNSQWLLTLLVKGKLMLEDLDKAPAYLQRFGQIKHLLPKELRDLNRIGSLADLYTAIEPHEETQSQDEIDRQYDAAMQAQTQIVYNGPDYKILIPKTKEASCYYGRNTQWCTAATETTNYFDSYNKKGPLYIILDKKNNRRWQFHFEDRQFMNERDQPIDVKAFLREHPKVERIFASLDDDMQQLGVYNGLLVLKRGNVVVFKQARGPFYSVRAKITADDKGVIDEFGIGTGEMFPHGFPHDHQHDAQLAEILNKTGFKLNHEGVSHHRHRSAAINMHNIGIFYDEKRQKFAPIHETGSDYMSFDRSRWVMHRAAGETFFELVTNDLAPQTIISARLARGELVIGLPRAEKDNPSLGDRIVDLILKHENEVEKVAEPVRSYSTGKTKGYDIDHMLSPEQLARIIEVRPDLVGVYALWRVVGDTPEVREKIGEKFEEIGKSVTFTKDGIVCETFATVDDFVDEYGSEFMKRVHNEFNGAGEFNYDYNVDNDEAEELFKKLPEKYKKWIGNQIAATYGEDQYGDEIDPDNAEQVWDVLTEQDDDILMTLRHAVMSGLETGAQDEMHDDYIGALKKAAQDTPVTVHYTMYEHEGKQRITLDSPVTLTMTVAHAARICDDEDALSDIENQGWLGKEIEIDEPYNGWSGYSDESALDHFDGMNELDDKYEPKEEKKAKPKKKKGG
jgi:hypothetical protein